VIQLDDIAKSYAGQAIFRGLTWRIPDGERIGLVGPNGAGKTTLLNVLAGSLRPNGGRVELQGGDVTSASAAKRCRLGIGRAHHVAGVDQPRAESPVDRCSDVGIAEVEPRGVDLCLVALDRRLQLGHQRLRLFVGLLRLVSGGRQLALAEVGPVAYSEGMRMAALVYAGRAADQEDEE